MLRSCAFLRGVPTLNTDAAGSTPPDAFGPFRVLHQIGAGALGPVFRAYQPEPGRLVAVKLFRLDLAPERVHQLVAALEGLVAIELAHPGIAAPVGAGLTGVSAYLAQDFVAAESLDVVVRSGGSPSPAVVARVAAQLGSALDYAADQGVLHGALHPRDVMLSDDDARMTGLGVARALEQVGIVTPVRRPYSAPERAVGGPWDGRADMYSLAALMFELLVGRRITGAGERAVTALPEIAGTNRAALKRVFARALSADPRGRFPSGTAFAEALGLALVETQPSAVPLLFEPTDAAAKEPEPGSDLLPARPSARPSARPRGRRTPPVSAAEETLAVDRLHGVEADADPEVTHLPSTATPAQETHDEDRPTASTAKNAMESALEGNIHGAVSGDVLGDVRSEPAEAPLLLIEDPSFGITGLFSGVNSGVNAGVGDDSNDSSDLGANDRGDAPAHTLAQSVAPADGLVPYQASDSHAHDLDLHANLHADVDADVDADVPGGLHAGDVDRHESASGVSLHSPSDRLRESSSEPAPSSGSLATPFSAMTLESTRSAVWPLLLSLVVGIAIGFGLAMAFFVGGGQTRQGNQIVTAGRPGPTVLADEPIVAGADAARPSAPTLVATDRSGGSTPPALPPAATVPAQQASVSRPLPPPAPTSTVLAAGAPVRARPQPAPSAQAAGRLLVRSTPLGAQVSVDGKSAGVTPLTLREVSHGFHTVRVAREGFVTVERRVALTAALPAVTVSVNLVRVRPVPKSAAPVAPARRPSPPAATGGTATGALAVDSRPVGASVFIDGKLVGTTPLMIPTISATDHAISIELAGYTRWNSSVKIAPGERTRVAASLGQ